MPTDSSRAVVPITPEPGAGAGQNVPARQPDIWSNARAALVLLQDVLASDAKTRRLVRILCPICLSAVAVAVCVAIAALVAINHAPPLAVTGTGAATLAVGVAVAAARRRRTATRRARRTKIGSGRRGNRSTRDRPGSARRPRNR